MDIIVEILTGMDPAGNIHVEPERKKAITWALEHAQDGDVIVLAGKGHETEQEIKGQLLHLDEREVVRDWFDAGGKRKEGTGNSLQAVVYYLPYSCGSSTPLPEKEIPWRFSI